MSTFLSFVFRIVSVLLLSAGLPAIPGQTATAQTSEDAPPSLIQHLRGDLKSKNAAERENALVDVIALSSCSEKCTVTLRSTKGKILSINDETRMGGVLELNGLVPELLTAYRSGPADEHRLLALSALITIGNETALERLIDESAR